MCSRPSGTAALAGSIPERCRVAGNQAGSLDNLSDSKQAEGVDNSTLNRVLGVARIILRKAYNGWEWLDRVPVVRMLPERTNRVRWITRNEADRSIAALPPRLADIVRFSLETDLRRSNVTGLQWSQVDLVRRTAWIHPDQAEARKAIPVPLSSVAVAVLRKQIGKHQANVFSFRGKRVRQVNGKAWHKSLKQVASRISAGMTSDTPGRAGTFKKALR
jgi:integrase